MLNFGKKILIGKITSALIDSRQYINKLMLEYSKGRGLLTILDVGCGTGEKYNVFFNNLKSFKLYGLDLLNKCPNDLLYKYIKANVDREGIPFKDEMFDIVYSNQVIEHLLNKDNFISEIFRVLKKNGLFIVATENIASFDNIISLLLAQEPLSQHSSNQYFINSFLSPHFMEKVRKVTKGNLGHINVCSYYSFRRLIKMNGFKKVKIVSFGNILKIFEVLFPFYNRILLAYGVKE